MKVSIITPSYNQGKFIEKTLLSVLCQDYPDIEYIVVDGNSTDETIKILEYYKDYIDYLIIEPDRGQSDALNKGFRLATGDILAYLNSDDVYADQNVISTAVKYFQETSADVVYGCRKFISEDGYQTNFHPYREFSEEYLVWTDYIPQECTFWGRSIFRKSGEWINEEFDFTMDYELWFRFLKQNAQFYAAPETFGLFRYYPDQKTRSRWKTVGLPEIAKLHQRYNGSTVSQDRMQAYFAEYTFGSSNQEIISTIYQSWKNYTEFESKVFERLPIDNWVYYHPINPRRLQKNL
jgi:glycosyltransferase involved in cell wall biosynthesis